MALARKFRLNKESDISRVFNEGRAVRNSFLFVKILENNLGHYRAVVIVSKKISAKAVIRNKIKRVILETIRQAISNKSVDVVIVPTPTILGKASKEIKGSIEKTINSIVVK